jgi:hypothetical protein
MKKPALLAISSITTLGLLASLLAPATQVNAAQTNPQNSGQALEIAPPVLSLSANPGETINSQISLRDVSSTSLRVTGQVNDFVANGEDGTPKILLEEDEASPYSLKDWVSPLPTLLLKSRQIENLPVTINVPANAAPGGYFGVVRFTATPPELEGTGVSLSASLGALILLKVNGAAKEGLAIEEFSVNSGGKSKSVFESTPLTFLQRVKNTGNIHEQPAGQVVVKDMFGKTVAAVNINLPPRNILPQSIRKFEQKLDSSVLGNKKLFGKYTATLNITYGTNKQTVSSTTSFWVIPYTLIGVGIIALVVGFLGLRVLIRRYNRHIIKQATKSKRK